MADAADSPRPAAAPAPAAEAAPAAPAEAPSPCPPPAPGPGRRAVEPVAPAPAPVQADTQELALVEGGLSPALAADVVAETVSHLLPFGTPRQLKRLVRQALARRIPVQGPRALGGAALVLAGAGGSGKTPDRRPPRRRLRRSAATSTSSCSRCARATAARSSRACSPRPASPSRSSSPPPRRRPASPRWPDRALVLVDTPAVSPGDEEGVKAFAADLRRLKGAEVHLCIPATLSAAAAKRLLAAFARSSRRGIALTHVDETPQVGAVVELAITGGPALTFIGRDTGLEGGLELADAGGRRRAGAAVKHLEPGQTVLVRLTGAAASPRASTPSAPTTRR